MRSDSPDRLTMTMRVSGRSGESAALGCGFRRYRFGSPSLDGDQAVRRRVRTAGYRRIDRRGAVRVKADAGRVERNSTLRRIRRWQRAQGAVDREAEARKGAVQRAAAARRVARGRRAGPPRRAIRQEADATTRHRRSWWESARHRSLSPRTCVGGRISRFLPPAGCRTDSWFEQRRLAGAGRGARHGEGARWSEGRGGELRLGTG